MNEHQKLDMGQKHILKLIARDANSEGWATVSEMLYKPLIETMPKDLVVLEKLDVGGRVKLTPQGTEIINAMAWL